MIICILQRVHTTSLLSIQIDKYKTSIRHRRRLATKTLFGFQMNPVFVLRISDLHYIAPSNLSYLNQLEKYRSHFIMLYFICELQTKMSI